MKTLNKLEETLKYAKELNIPIHLKLLIFKQCIVTSANWGPLLDVCPGSKETYKEIDEKLYQILDDILDN
jgi:hypothetical protein